MNIMLYLEFIPFDVIQDNLQWSVCVENVTGRAIGHELYFTNHVNIFLKYCVQKNKHDVWLVIY